MIATQAEIDLVLNPKMRRRMMRLPAPNRKCPVKHGGTYKLQPRAGAKGQATIVVLEPPRRESLAALSLSDARREGYGSIAGAIEAWVRAYWPPPEDQLVWVISFARDEKGECAEFLAQDESIYLAKVGEFTTQAGRQAVPGDPPLLATFEEDLTRARAAARERHMPQMQAIGRMRADAETLREAMLAMKANNALKLVRHIEKDLDRLRAYFTIDDSAIPYGESHVLSVAEESAHISGDPVPSSTQPVVPLEVVG